MKLAFIEAGEIVTVHGIHGEVKVYPWLDGPEDLCEFKRCQIDGNDYLIEACRVQKNCCLVKLKGVDTVEQGQSLRGKILTLYRQDMDNSLIFAAELIGVEVYCEERLIGKITDVLDYPGNKVYVVRGKHEYMIPAVKAFVVSTNLELNRMQVNLIEGMRTDES